FTADQDGAARELLRVCRPGGRIGLANWTPDGFIGQLFQLVGRHVPPARGLRSPLQWGTPDRLRELFPPHAADLAVQRREFCFRYRSPEHWLEVFRTFYGPVVRAFAALPAIGRAALATDLLALVRRNNRARDASMVVPSAWLEVVVTRSTPTDSPPSPERTPS